MIPCPGAGCRKPARPVRRAGGEHGSIGDVEGSAPERAGHRGGSVSTPRHLSTLLAVRREIDEPRDASGARSPVAPRRTRAVHRGFEGREPNAQRPFTAADRRLPQKC